MDRHPDLSTAAAAGGAPAVDGSGAAGAEAEMEVEAAVVAPPPGSAYAMYRATGVSAEGATLAGGLLLEKGEELTLELRLSERGSVRARARVVEIDLARARMQVTFLGLEEADRQRLGRHAAASPATP